MRKRKRCHLWRAFVEKHAEAYTIALSSCGRWGRFLGDSHLDEMTRGWVHVTCKKCLVLKVTK